MIHHGEGKIGAAELAAFGFEAGEALRGSGFVDEVAVDVNDVGLVGLLVDEMGIPNFLVKSFRRHRGSIRMVALREYMSNQIEMRRSINIANRGVDAYLRRKTGVGLNLLTM